MTGSVALPAFRRDDDTWGCNVAADCTEPASLQATVGCDSCLPHANAAAGKRDALLAEADRHADVMAEVEAAVRADERAATDAEAGRWLVAHNAQAAALHEAHRLTQTAARHAGPHTHPVFACETHAHLLDGE